MCKDIKIMVDRFIHNIDEFIDNNIIVDSELDDEDLLEV